MAQTIVTGRRADLTYDNYIAYNPSGWTPDGYIGWWKRQSGIGYILECFSEFDIVAAGLSGVDVTSAYIEYDVDSTGTPPSSSKQSRLINQDKKSYSVWYSNSRQPWFDDFFGVGIEEWDTIIDTISVQAKNTTYQFSANAAMRALVQDWVDGTIDWRNGIIIDGDFTSVSWWMHVTAVRLVVDYNEANNGWINNFLNNKKN